MSEAAILALLKASAAVTALVGSGSNARIYAMTAPQRVTTPYVTYQRISGERWRTMDGPTGMAQPRIQVDAFATTYAGTKALGTAVRQALDGYRGTIGGVRVGGIAIMTDMDLYESDVDPKLYRVSMDFMVTHDE